MRVSAEALRFASADERERLLTELVRESARAAHLVNSLLTLAGLDQGRKLHVAGCDLAALCGEEAERARALAPHLEVAVRMVGGVPREPVLDRDVIGEILAPLLDNARRHAHRRVEISVAGGGDTVELQIRDDGPVSRRSSWSAPSSASSASTAGAARAWGCRSPAALPARTVAS